MIRYNNCVIFTLMLLLLRIQSIVCFRSIQRPINNNYYSSRRTQKYINHLYLLNDSYKQTYRKLTFGLRNQQKVLVLLHATVSIDDPNSNESIVDDEQQISSINESSLLSSSDNKIEVLYNTDDNDDDTTIQQNTERSSTTITSKQQVERELGGYDPSERLRGREINVGDPQTKLQEKEFSVTAILRELKAIQQKGQQKYCILGTRHCSYLHQQIIELL